MRTAKRPSPPSSRRVADVLSRRTFSAESSQLDEVCDTVREAAGVSGFDDRTSYACQLAVCEAVENVIQHGYRGGGGQVILETRARPGNLEVEIVDDAPPFDPTTYTAPSGDALEDVQIGGRGLLMIHRVMDQILYERRGKKNVLRLTKNRAFTGV